MMNGKLISKADIYDAAKKRFTPREFKIFKESIDKILSVVNQEKGVSTAKGWLAGWKAAVEFGAGLYYHEVEIKPFIEGGLKLMEIAAEEENPAILGL